VNFAPGKIPLGGKISAKMYIILMHGVPAQELDGQTYGAKFGWSPVSDITAVTKARRETR